MGPAGHHLIALGGGAKEGVGMDAKRAWAEYSKARAAAELEREQVGLVQLVFLRAMAEAKAALRRLQASRSRYAEAARTARTLLERAREAQAAEDARMRRSA